MAADDASGVRRPGAGRDEGGRDDAPSPAVDLMAGVFLGLWAVAGLWSYLGNAPLRASLWAGPDPGPALLAVIILWVLGIGAGWLLLRGLLRWGGSGPGMVAGDLPAAHRHVLPALFALSVLGVALMMKVVGFLAAGLAFCLVWLVALSDPPRLRPGRIAVALGAAVLVTFAVWLVFARLLLVPLPR